MEVMRPMGREMTIVAALSSPEMIAREEARTVIWGASSVDMLVLMGGFDVDLGLDGLEKVGRLSRQQERDVVRVN